MLALRYIVIYYIMLFVNKVYAPEKNSTVGWVQRGNLKDVSTLT